MSPWLKKSLKPLFRLLAEPGLGNPHTPYEAELMVRGAKPVAILTPEDVTTEMSQAITNGHIIKIDEHGFEETHRIYYHPDEIDNAENAARILQQIYETKKYDSISTEGHEFLNGFFLKPLGDTPVHSSDNITPLAHSYEIEHALYNGQIPSEVENILNGMLTALPPLHYVPESAPAILENAIKEGTLKSVDIKNTQLIQVFAQANKKAEGEELNARYYLDNHGYPELLPEEGSKRIGQLLGYTENDLNWHLGTKYQNPVIKNLMDRTEQLRHWARKELMLMEIPEQDISQPLTNTPLTPSHL